MKPIAIVSLLAAAALAATTISPVRALAGEAPRALTFQGAIELALGHSPEVAMAREGIAGAEARTAGLKARRLPSLHLEAAGNLFREAYELPFGSEVVTLH